MCWAGGGPLAEAVPARPNPGNFPTSSLYVQYAPIEYITLPLGKFATSFTQFLVRCPPPPQICVTSNFNVICSCASNPHALRPSVQKAVLHKRRESLPYRIDEMWALQRLLSLCEIVSCRTSALHSHSGLGCRMLKCHAFRIDNLAVSVRVQAVKLSSSVRSCHLELPSCLAARLA